MTLSYTIIIISHVTYTLQLYSAMLSCNLPCLGDEKRGNANAEYIRAPLPPPPQYRIHAKNKIVGRIVHFGLKARDHDSSWVVPAKWHGTGAFYGGFIPYVLHLVLKTG